jgi:hypothetical protein
VAKFPSPIEVVFPDIDLQASRSTFLSSSEVMDYGADHSRVMLFLLPVCPPDGVQHSTDFLNR